MTARTLVIGATGRVGSEVVAGLAMKGIPVRAATRNPGGARLVLPAAAQPALFDYDRPGTWAPALEGIERLYLSVRPGDDRSDETAAPLLRQAASLGVRQVVTLTAMGVERLGDNALRRIEQAAEASGMTWTHLRPNFFMQIFSAPPLLDQVRRHRSLRIPAGNARLSFVDVRDIAAVAVECLVDDRHAGKAYTLTGPEAIDHAAVAAAISAETAETGRPVVYEPLDDDTARIEMAIAGLSPRRVERLIDFYRLVRAGACSEVSGDTERVLHRPSGSFAAFAARCRLAWA